MIFTLHSINYTSTALANNNSSISFDFHVWCVSIYSELNTEYVYLFEIRRKLLIGWKQIKELRFITWQDGRAFCDFFPVRNNQIITALNVHIDYLMKKSSSASFSLEKLWLDVISDDLIFMFQRFFWRLHHDVNHINQVSNSDETENCANI